MTYKYFITTKNMQTWQFKDQTKELRWTLSCSLYKILIAYLLTVWEAVTSHPATGVRSLVKGNANYYLFVLILILISKNV